MQLETAESSSSSLTRPRKTIAQNLANDTMAYIEGASLGINANWLGFYCVAATEGVVAASYYNMALGQWGFATFDAQTRAFRGNVLSDGSNGGNFGHDLYAHDGLLYVPTSISLLTYDIATLALVHVQAQDRLYGALTIGSDNQPIINHNSVLYRRNAATGDFALLEPLTQITGNLATYMESGDRVLFQEANYMFKIIDLGTGETVVVNPTTVDVPYLLPNGFIAVMQSNGLSAAVPADGLIP